MTNAQKWVSIFLLLFVLLLVISKLTRREENQSYEENDETSYSQTTTDSLDIVDILISKNKCRDCHGENLDGSNSGPSLLELNKMWEKSDLVEFLKNPKTFKDDPRLSKNKGKYRFSMPSFIKMSEEELSTLADYLLENN